MSDDRWKWNEFLDVFHTERPGITEAILSIARADDGSDPYAWMLEAFPQHGVTVDIACGNGPLASRGAHRWVGLDRSHAELGLAASRTTRPVVVGDATTPPFRDGAASAVACSMALMVFDDPRSAILGMARLLRPDGTLVALLPATSPLTTRDRFRYVRLLSALRLRRFPFPQHQVLDDPWAQFARAGLTAVGDERRRFVYEFTDPDAGYRWLRSLYLPDLSARRELAALQIIGHWTGSSIGIPLRRLVATNSPDS